MSKQLILSLALIVAAQAQFAAPVFPTRKLSVGQTSCGCSPVSSTGPVCRGGSRDTQPCTQVQPEITGACNLQSTESFQPCGGGVPGAVACTDSLNRCMGPNQANFPNVPTTAATGAACQGGVSSVTGYITPVTGGTGYANTGTSVALLPTVLFSGGGRRGTCSPGNTGTQCMTNADCGGGNVCSSTTTASATAVINGRALTGFTALVGGNNYAGTPLVTLISAGTTTATPTLSKAATTATLASLPSAMVTGLTTADSIEVRGCATGAGNTAYCGTKPILGKPTATSVTYTIDNGATGAGPTWKVNNAVITAMTCADNWCLDGLVTATAANHGLDAVATQVYVRISGATQAGYNGLQRLVQVTTNTFQFRVAVGTVSPSTGARRVNSGVWWIGNGAGATATSTIHTGDAYCQVRYGPLAHCGVGATTGSRCNANIRRSTAYGWGTCTANTCQCPPRPNTGNPTNSGVRRVCGPGESPVMTCAAPANPNQRCDGGQALNYCSTLTGVPTTCSIPSCVIPGICTARSVHSDGPYQQTMFCDRGINVDKPCTMATVAIDCPVYSGTAAACIWSHPVCSGGLNAGKRCDMANTAAGTGTGSGRTAYLDCPGEKVPRGPWGQVATPPTPYGYCSGGANYLGDCEGLANGPNTNAGLAISCGNAGSVACVGVTGEAASVVCRPETMGRCVGGTTPGRLCPDRVGGVPSGLDMPGGIDCVCAGGSPGCSSNVVGTPGINNAMCVMPATRSPSRPANPCVRNTPASDFKLGLSDVGTTCNFDEKCTSTGIGNGTLSFCLPKDNEICVRFMQLGKETADGGAGMDTTQAPKGCKSTEKCCDGDCCSWNEGCMTQESGSFYYNSQSYMAESVARNDWKMPDATEIKNKPRRCMAQNTWMNATAGLKVIVLPVFGILLTAFCFMQANKNKTGEMSENMGPMLMIFFSFWLLFSYHIMVALISILVATATMVAPPAWTSWVLFFQILFFWWTIGGSSFFLTTGGVYGNNFIADMVSTGPNQVNTMATSCATYFNFFQYQNVATPGTGNMKYMSNPARTTWGYCSLEFVSFGATFAVFSLLAYFATIVQTTIRCLTSGDSSRASQALTAAKV